MKCPKCHFENPADARFCNQCGDKFEIACPACGKTNPPGSRFCNGCGQGLEQGTRAPPPHDSQPSSTTPEFAAKKPLPIQRAAEGERKHVTVLFSDLSGYTALSEKLDPEELKEFTGTLFGRMTRVIEKYGGFVEKYVGDAVMAVFGIPLSHEDDPVRAIRAAREIHEIASDEKAATPLSMHSGINTGLAVTGAMDGQKGIHGIAGDTVNVASRLCGLAKPGEIVIGSETWHQAEGSFDVEELPFATVKGKAEPLRVFKVLSPKEKPLTVHRLSGVRARLTGRDAEMAELQDAVERLSHDEGTIIAISGDAGTGKSRLIEEFKKTIPQTQWFEVHAYPYAQNTPYSLITGLLSGVFDIEEGDAPETVKEKVEGRIRAVTGNGSSIMPSLGSLYSLTYPSLDETTPKHRKFLLEKAFAELVSALSHHPLAIVFDDLQWADPSSVELLRSLLMEIRLPSLFLFSSRPEFSLFTGDQAPSLGGTYQEIRLHDLSSSESLQMLRSLLGTDDVPRELQRFFQDQSQGNPFYLEEVVNGLIDSGTLSRRGTTWKLEGSLDEGKISSSVHGVIEARLDRLEKEAKRVLQEASVIGRSFLYEILRRITVLADQCEHQISGLEQRDFIRTKTLDPDLEYIFKHALTQEVVYNGLLKKDRREIHEKIAHVMEGLFSQRLSEFYETLAYHYSRGESSSKAIEYLMKAGEKSLARYSVSEANRSYEEAYQLITAKTPRTKEESAILIDILINWVYVFYFLGDAKTWLQIYERHEEEAASLEDQARKAMFFAWFGWGHFGSGHIRVGRDYILKALKLAQTVGDQRALGYAYTFLSWVGGSTGMFEEGLDAARKALEIGKAYPWDHYISFKGLAGMSFVHWGMGDLRSAAADVEAQLEYGREHSNHRSLVLAYLGMANVHFGKGDVALAIECCRKSIDAARDPQYAQVARPFLAAALLMAGKLDEAEEELKTAIAFDERGGAGWLAVWAYLFRAILRIARGQVSEGLKELEALRHSSVENGALAVRIMAEQYLGTVYLKMVEGGGPSNLTTVAKNLPFLITNLPFADGRAQKHLGEAIRLSREVGAKLQLGQAYLSLGLLHKAKRRMEKAKERLTEAVRLLAECEADGPLREAASALESLGTPTGTPRSP